MPNQSTDGTYARILIVDDSSTTRKAIRLMLSGEQVECVEAADGVQALAVLESEHIDLVLTDMHMPNMDGIGLIRSARQLKQHTSTPILVLTTEGHDDVLEDIRWAGASGVLEKPVERNALSRALKWHLT